MKLEIFTVYDSKAESYLPPFFLPQIAQAKRSFANCCKDKENHAFGQNPQDYTLFHLGQYDDGNATIENNKIISLGNGIEFFTQLNCAPPVEDEENAVSDEPSIQPGATG